MGVESYYCLFNPLSQTETVEEPIEDDSEATEEPEKEAEDEAEVEEEEEDKEKPKTKKVGLAVLKLAAGKCWRRQLNLRNITEEGSERARRVLSFLTVSG